MDILGCIVVLGDIDPVTLGVAVIDADVIDVLGSLTVNLLVQSDGVLAHVGDLGNRQGMIDNCIALAVAVVVHQLKGEGIFAVLHGIQAGVAVGVISADAALTLVEGLGLFAGVAQLVGRAVDVNGLGVRSHVDLTGSAGGNDGAVAGINAVDNLAVLDVVDHLDALAVESRVVIASGQRSAACADGIVGDGVAAEGSTSGEVVGPLLLHGIVVIATHVGITDRALVLVSQQGVRNRLRSAALNGIVVQPGGIALGLLAGGGVQGPAALHHGSLHSIVHELSSVIAGDGQVGLQAAQLVIQASLVGIAVDVGVPAGAAEAEHSGVVAHSGQHHLGSLGAGQSAVGSKLAAANAANDAHAGGVLNVSLAPVTLDIRVGRSSAGAQNGSLAAVHDVGHHLAHLSAGQIAVGVELTLVITADDVQGVHDLNGFLVADFIIVVEIGSCCTGADAQTEHSGHGQHQCKNLLQILHF